MPSSISKKATAELPSPLEIREELEREARALGFSAFGIADPRGIAHAGDKLMEFLAANRHGEMDWMADRVHWRRDPSALWSAARSVIVLTMNYGPDEDPLPRLEQRDRGVISVYAQNRDYHDLVKKRLKALARFLVARTGAEVKVFVDTAPVMEKPLAQAAALGWQGKHTNMVSKTHGSWTFIGSVFTTLELPQDKPETDHCGSCHRCLDICPTNAFPAPYQLDARRCISYLTIEYKGHIPREFRAPMGNRIYGCDDCLAVCPWNKFAQTASEAAFHPREELRAPLLADLARLDDSAFRALFSGSPIKRIGRDRFVRNVMIAIGNAGDPTLAPVAEERLGDASPLVRAMAVWALSRLLPETQFAALRRGRAGQEIDQAVKGEWFIEPPGPATSPPADSMPD